MSKQLVTFKCDDAPSLETVKERFALHDDDIDPSFGVVEVDPDAHLYTALVEPAAASKMQQTEPETGVYANPEISTFDMSDE